MLFRKFHNATHFIAFPIYDLSIFIYFSAVEIDHARCSMRLAINGNRLFRTIQS